MSKLSNLFNLTGRTAIVTGGAGLLGTEFCKSLAEAGAAVIVADVNIDAAQDVAESLTKKGHDVVGFEIDITSEISVGQLVVSAIQQFKQIDILVNSGIASMSALSMKRDPWPERAFKSNFSAL